LTTPGTTSILDLSDGGTFGRSWGRSNSAGRFHLDFDDRLDRRSRAVALDFRRVATSLGSGFTVGATMATTTKKELIDRIADETQLKRADVKKAVQAFLDHVIEELGRGNRLEFRDFGVFEIKDRAPRVAQNPKTLEPVQVPAKRTVKFKVGRLMKASVDGEPIEREIESDADDV
jgi:integration host factor subunit beta